MVSYKATHSQEPIFSMSNSSQYLQRKISSTYQTKAHVQLQACLKVDWKGVHKLLKNLKTHKATGPDSIPAFTLKAAADELAPALAVLFQLSLDQGEIPADWREALVVPIFKKGDKHQASNYRPVSLTTITCKLLEHIIHSSIMKHFDKHKILCDNQHGFRKKRSCETQLLSTAQEIASSTAKGK